MVDIGAGLPVYMSDIKQNWGLRPPVFLLTFGLPCGTFWVADLAMFTHEITHGIAKSVVAQHGLVIFDTVRFPLSALFYTIFADPSRKTGCNAAETNAWILQYKNLTFYFVPLPC